MDTPAMTVRSTLKLLIVRENVNRIQKQQSPLTLQELSSSTGLAPSTLTGLTAGRATRIDFRTIDKLCEFFGVQPGELFVWEPENSGRWEDKNNK